MTDWMALLAPALAAGLFGSAHCLGMCGGLSGLFAMRSGAKATSADPVLAVSYNLGRLTSYALLGAGAALAGSGLTDMLPALVVPMRLLAGFIIILMGLQIAFGWKLLAPLEEAGSRLWNLVAPSAQKLLPATTPARALSLGLAWGLLPCGLVYSMLLVAMANANPLAGALVMATFGLGTMPAMLMTGLSAARLSSMLANRKRALAAGILLVVIGVATIAMPAMKVIKSNDGHMQHQHMAVVDPVS